MAHNLDGDAKLSDENDEEEIDGEKEMKIEKEEKRESIRENLREKDSRSSHMEPTWIGLPLKSKSNGDLYYSAVKVDKYKFRVGDCAYFTPNSDDQIPYIGQITKLWQSKVKHNGGSTDLQSDQMLVQCVWYYYPEDTHIGRTKKNHKHELFLSDLSDINSVGSLLSPIEVISFQDYNRKVTSTPKKELKELYFCRYFYSESSKEFYPLKLDSTNGHFNIEGLLTQEPIKRPKNWPKGLDYSQSCMWRNIPEPIKNYLQTKVSPNTELRPESEQTHKLGLYAIKDLKKGTTIGEYTGYLCVNGEEDEEDGDVDIDSSPKTKSSKFLKVLCEDNEVSVSVDATNSGNEFRFIKDSNAKGKPANVCFVPLQLDGRWHLSVVALVDINTNDELLVDTKTKYWISQV